MNTRIRVRSPRNRSVIGGGASEKFVAERRTRHDGGDTAEDGGGHVQPRPQVVTVVQQRDALVTERTHGGECAAETNCESRAHVRRNDRRSRGDPEYKAEEEGAADQRLLPPRLYTPDRHGSGGHFAGHARGTHNWFLRRIHHHEYVQLRERHAAERR